MHRHDIICPNPNCGFHGRGKARGRHSNVTFLGLVGITLLSLLLFFPLGLVMLLVLLLYVITAGSGVNLHCPRCRMIAR